MLELVKTGRTMANIAAEFGITKRWLWEMRSKEVGGDLPAGFLLQAQI